MAEKAEASNSSENLTCPLCLDIFVEATTLTRCGHSFCKRCLYNYDKSHQDMSIDHMVCPLCRKITKFTSSNRVDDFPANVTVNGFVDDYHVKCGGMNAILEMRPKCIVCPFQRDAFSFCKTCNNFMCTDCDISHKHMKLFFEGHEIVPMDDVIKGNVIIGQSSEKCCVHKQEDKDMFCEDCKVHVCHKCVLVAHKNHDIKNQSDFEKELRLRVNDLVQRCAGKKTELEKNIQTIEAQRHEVHSAMQKIQNDVDGAYNIKIKELKENHRKLSEELRNSKQTYDDDFNVLKSKDRQRIKSICSSVALVDNDRLGHLETDTLSAHILFCEELDAMLKEATDHTSAADITKKAQKKRFKPADNTRLDLGSISESIDQTSTATIKKKAQEKKFNPADDLGGISESTDQTSTATIKKKAQEKKFNPADDPRLDLSSISRSDPKLRIIQRVYLWGWMMGMTRYSDDSVGIGYKNGIYIINSHGNRQQYQNIPSNMKCYDLVFQQDRSLCISTSTTEAHVYSPNGIEKSTIRVRDNGNHLRLDRSPGDEFVIAHHRKQVYIYSPTGSTLKHTVKTRHVTRQAPATRSGLIVTSSCNANPSVVTVYDRDGNAGESLQATKDVYLYAAVDEQDRVYVASVDRENDKVVIRLYDLDGLNLKERVKFNAFNLPAINSFGFNAHGWCYLVSLSPDMLAFACNNGWRLKSELYFIKVSV